jgi:hypothetical protein
MKSSVDEIWSLFVWLKSVVSFLMFIRGGHDVFVTNVRTTHCSWCSQGILSWVTGAHHVVLTLSWISQSGRFVSLNSQLTISNLRVDSEQWEINTIYL